MTRAQLEAWFKPVLRNWLDQYPQRAGDIRKRVCEALGLKPEEFDQWVGAPAEKRAKASDKIEPLRPAPMNGSERPDVSNYGFNEKEKANKKTGELETTHVPAARTIADIRADILKALQGWPHRIYARGALRPLLFVHVKGHARVREIVDRADLQALLHEYATLSFNHGQDADGRNYVSLESLYKSFGGSEYVREWDAVEEFPHVPRLKGHYYTYASPKGYEPKGEAFCTLLSFFSTIKKVEHRALFAASVLTPFAGLPYGARPAFAYEADQRGSGKTTAVETVGRLCGGALSVDLDERAIERLKERLLSSEGWYKRVGLCDNVRRLVAGELIEQLVSSHRISGKRLYVGEASRPNTMTYYFTGNNLRMSPDMADRSYFIKFERPQFSEGWIDRLNEFVEQRKAHIVADICWILRQPKKPVAPGAESDDRFPSWVHNVLCAVFSVPCVYSQITEPVSDAPQDGGEVTLKQVLALNHQRRISADEEREEAAVFIAGLLERVCVWKALYDKPAELIQDVFVPTSPPAKAVGLDFDGETDKEAEAATKHNMINYWYQIFNRRINAKWLSNILRAHIESGRIEGLTPTRTRIARGYTLSRKTVIDYINERQSNSVTDVTMSQSVSVTPQLPLAQGDAGA